MRYFIIFAAAAFLVAGVTPHLLEQRIHAPAAQVESVAAPAAPDALPPATAAAVTFQSDRSGHFRVEGSVNGRRLAFLVDTGASVVALTSRHAEELRIFPRPSDYVVPIQTANGTLKAAQVRLSTVTVGPLRVRDVRAVVMPHGALSENLLGMTFLSGLRRFEIRSGRLILEQ